MSATRRHGFAIRVLPGVSRRAERIVRDLFDRVDVTLRHQLDVLVVPHPVVGDGEGGVGFACFGAPPTADRDPVLCIATGKWWMIDVAECRRMVLHELAHYEQFRDGRPLTERGVERRARTLLRTLKPRRRAAA